MVRSIYEHIALIDTAAAIALLDPTERFHKDATTCFQHSDVAWASLNVTGHEAYTRARYKGADPSGAVEHYELLRGYGVTVLAFESGDESSAIAILRKYSDQSLSFHDALCAAVMTRLGIYRVFTFDHHFLTLGFELIPGLY
jgi:uncharacterized protein